MEPTRTCPQCQKPLRHDAPDGLCPECLMKVGLGSVPEPTGTIRVGEEAVRTRELPTAGTQFGGYRIVRELGRGGMGAVYEAEHLESGRRVALKVLSHQLDSMTDRARFLREGRLAGSINHPNSVYVFGTEEIEDTPVIAMELIAGGTLQERVQRDGPLPIGEAVDAILQVIAGLEAAQAIGILHRDIKPANCFQDPDGTVKVGDFGLSISTVGRGDTNITMHGQFLGTPAFCSPEQLRGEELNVRSDMYSVGVTLFYLLAGRTPFEGKNAVQMLSNVIEQPAPSPRKFRAAIPRGLANAVLRCLQKQPGDRFRNYDELRQALAPFSSDAPIPAPLGLRFAAGMADGMLISGTMMIVSFFLLGDLATYTNPASYRSPQMFAMMAGAFSVWLLYYALLEGLCGASLGKALFRLRVAGSDRNPPGVLKAFGRACIYLLPPIAPFWIGMLIDPSGFPGIGTTWTRFGSLLYYALIALLFSTARARNGFAAIQDLLTNTRVIRKAAHQARPVLTSKEDVAPAAEDRPKVGPFHIIKTLEKTMEGEWLLGYDTRLLRKVWIHVVSPGTPAIAPALRNLGRVGRLRWISGRRSEEENWDVFEGVTGAALAGLLAQPQSWSLVRYWLLDLATEIAVAEKDGTLPVVLALDRVWITADGRAKLLDFPAPGCTAIPQAEFSAETMNPEIPSVRTDVGSDDTSGPPLVDRDAKRFLALIACVALEGRKVVEEKQIPYALPIHARSFLEKLTTFASADAIVTALKPLLHRAAAVSRLRRAGVVVGCLAFPLLTCIGMIFGMRVYNQWQRSQPELADLAQVLNFRAVMNMPWFKSSLPPDDRTFAIYIASHHRQTITNGHEWNTLYALSMINGEKRRFAEKSVAEHPNPTEKEIRDAAERMKPLVKQNDPAKSISSRPWFPLLVFAASLLIYVALPALLAALIFRGGVVMRGFGLAVAKRDGTRASRLQVFGRSLIAWFPVLVAPVLLAVLSPLTGMPWAGTLVAALLVGLAAWSLALPGRGLQDRLAGTTLVPR